MTRTANDPSTFDSIDEHDADFYTRFLDARTAVEDERRVKQLIMTLLQLEDGLSVLDVGSGTGADTTTVAEAVAPNGRAVGLDYSERMVDEARSRVADSGLPIEFVHGDAHALPFDDDSFDRCRAERVLIHVADPAKAIGEMVRVTKPGGRVVISDLDLETLFLNSTNTRLAREAALALADETVSPWVGRRLQRLMTEAGLTDITCEPTVVLCTVPFLRMVLGGRLDRMAAAGQTSAEQVAEFWAELERGAEEGWLSSGIVCFNAVGRKA
jgi:ubiquinone/menaquinone biosynthesis C-methylase UbiE